MSKLIINPPNLKKIERIIGEGNTIQNGEQFEYKEGGNHVKGGVSYVFSELRVSFENMAVHRHDCANFLNSWLTDLTEAFRALKAGNNQDFQRMYLTVTKSMWEQIHYITTDQERILMNLGENIKDNISG